MRPRDWNRERYRTRDRLLEYDKSIYPQTPHTAGLNIIYPWENASLTILEKQLYQLAAASGYEGTEQEFNNGFGSFLQGRQIIFGTLDTFEPIDSTNYLYYDTTDNILYYYEKEFIPVNAMLIENTILDSGHAPQEEDDDNG